MKWNGNYAFYWGGCWFISWPRQWLSWEVTSVVSPVRPHKYQESTSNYAIVTSCLVLCTSFLGAFAKLRKRLLRSSCVCLSVSPYGTTRLQLNGFSWNLISQYFSKICRKIKFHSNLKKITGTVIKTYVHLKQYLAEFLEWEKFQTKVVQQIKTHILRSKTLFWKSCRLWDNVEKYGTTGQVADDNIMRRMRFASRITQATETHLEYAILLLYHSNNGQTNPPNVTLYVHRLSRFQ